MAHHECTYCPQADPKNRYLTGLYVCTLVHAVGLWHEQLRAIIENQERRIEGMLNRILRISTVSEETATSVAFMGKSVALCKRTLVHLEQTSKVLAYSTLSDSRF